VPPDTILVIVGDTVHHRDAEGRLCTHGALAAQLDLWARHFDRVRFCGVLSPGDPPPGFEPYHSANVELVPLEQAGGTGLRAKLGVLRAWHSWLGVMVPALKTADAVHLRTPCNVTIPGIAASRLLVRARYAVYAGSWQRYPGEPATYRLQRAALRRWFGGVVHAYLPVGGPLDRENVRPTFSPVLTAAELDEVAAAASQVRDQTPPLESGRALRVVCVGRFSTNKNQLTLLEALRRLQRLGVAVECRFIGDGSGARGVEAAASDLRGVSFMGQVDRAAVYRAMAWADLNVLPTFYEGYGKVLLEGMSAGALPVASDTLINRETTGGSGWVFDPHDAEDLAQVIASAIRMPREDWRERRSVAATYARHHTMDELGDEVDHIVGTIWGFGRTGGSHAPLP